MQGDDDVKKRKIQELKLILKELQIWLAGLIFAAAAGYLSWQVGRLISKVIW
jgi:ribosomal protein L29